MISESRSSGACVVLYLCPVLLSSRMPAGPELEGR